MGTAFTAAWTSDPRLCVTIAATGLSTPRGFAIAANGDIFVVERGRNAITVFFDTNHNGNFEASEHSTFAMMSGLNHGIAFSRDGRYLYASTTSTVYRWAYTAGSHMATGAAETVVASIPGGGNHPTRTLVFDTMGRLYVSVGSSSNLDQATSDLDTRSQVRRFTIPATLPGGGISYTTGERFAVGLRNEVGLMMDSMGRIWGVENGRDDTVTMAGCTVRTSGTPLACDVHYDNPGEELNRFLDVPGTFYGYPSCWSEGRVLAGGTGPGSQHGDVQSTSPAPRTDAWCNDNANVRKPIAVMPAHWAPLGLVEYTGNVLPAAWRGDLFVTSHGSWNSERGQVGRLIARADVQADGSVTSFTPIMGLNAGGMIDMMTGAFRPVDIHQGVDGALYLTDDGGGRIIRIGYH
jgi:glucose/arabinose dehydrogenase